MIKPSRFLSLKSISQVIEIEKFFSRFYAPRCWSILTSPLPCESQMWFAIARHQCWKGNVEEKFLCHPLKSSPLYSKGAYQLANTGHTWESPLTSSQLFLCPSVQSHKVKALLPNVILKHFPYPFWCINK